MVSLEYLAGLIDADGCISISKEKPSAKSRTVNTACLDVSNSCLPLLEEIKSQFGGFIRTRKFDNPNHNTNYVWGLASQALYPLLEELVGHLKIKSNQARLCLVLKNFNHNGNRSSDPGEVDIKEMLYLSVKEFNSGKYRGNRG